MNMRTTLRMVGAVIGAASLVGLAVPAQATTKCSSTIAKEAAKFTQAKAKILQKCEESILKDKAGFTSPPGQRCNDSQNKTSDAITKAEDKFKAAVAKACCGDDATCGTVDDQPGAFALGSCPDGDGPTVPASNCQGLLGDASDVADCIACLIEEQVDETIDLNYGAFADQAPGTDLNKCQAAIGKEAGKFLAAKSKALAKCADGVLKGQISGPCPDLEKALPAIEKAELKKVAGICKACGGDDKACDPKSCQNAGDLLGTPCTADSDCRVCDAGLKTGDACTTDVDCTVCEGGTEPGTPCFIAADCDGGGTCPARTCGDASGAGQCQAVGGDDLTVAAIGFAPSCRPLLEGGASGGAIEDLTDIVNCVDSTASNRVDCTDAAGSTVVSNVPGKCRATATSCSPSAGQTAVSVKYEGATAAGIVMAIGYKDASLPGSGEVLVQPGSRVETGQPGQAIANDLDDGLILSLAGLDPFIGDTLFTVTFDNCGAPVGTDDLTCLVVSASDANQEEIQEGIRCFVTIP